MARAHYVRNIPRLSTAMEAGPARRAVERLEEAIEELSRTDGSDSAVIALFTAVLAGIVPASGGGTTNFLRADGAWAAPPGGGGVPTTRLVNTTAPLTGGGDLSADRTLAITAFAGGAAGAVPVSPGGTAAFLRADGTWSAPVAVSAWTAATLALGSTAKTEHYITVTDGAIASTSKVAVAWGTCQDTDVNGPDMDTVTFSARPATGSAVIVVASLEPVSGPLKIIYQVGV